MRDIPVLMLLDRINITLEQRIIPGLPAGHLRSEARAIVSVLNNIAGRVEERCAVICQENRELRDALSAVSLLMNGSAGQVQIRNTVESVLKTEAKEPVEENRVLKEGVTNVIKVLPEANLSGDKYDQALKLINNALRVQLDRDKTLRRPTRIGQVSSKG